MFVALNKVKRFMTGGVLYRNTRLYEVTEDKAKELLRFREGDFPVFRAVLDPDECPELALIPLDRDEDTDDAEHITKPDDSTDSQPEAEQKSKPKSSGRGKRAGIKAGAQKSGGTKANPDETIEI